MQTDSEVDTDRTAVKTYVPAYQRELWDEHADRLDMSRSEFVRSMVQAGRRGFGGETVSGRSDSQSPEPDSDPEPSENEEFEALVLELLENEPREWDELLDELTDDIERRLEETLQDLQSSGRIRHSGREGGYVRDE